MENSFEEILDADPAWENNAIQKLSMTNRIGRSCAMFSFGIGTLIMLLELILSGENLIGVGFVYVGIATVVNLIVLLGVLISLITDKDQRQQTALTLLIMLANIPIVFIYLQIV